MKQKDNHAITRWMSFTNSNIKIRNGNSDGSHSEIAVSTELTWGPEEIKTGFDNMKIYGKSLEYKIFQDIEKFLFLP